jgi:hypothetical protein
MQENSTTQYAPFNSYNTCYSPSTGLFKQDIAVPKKTVIINGKPVELTFKVAASYDISGNNVSSMLQIVTHNEDYVGPVISNDYNLINPPNNDLNQVISNFKPSNENDVTVFTVHDEDFLSLSPATIQSIITELSNSQPLTIEEVEEILDQHLSSKSSLTQPRTVGTGVIPPKVSC